MSGSVLALVWIGCGKDDGGEPDGGGGTEAPPVDLVAPVPSGEARAGVISDESALTGGISAEGRAGDLMLVNDRVRYVIQGVRPGAWYVVEGGGVIDADLVRPAGVPGRDAVEEWNVMYGLGRLMVPEAAEVVNDGRDGEPAVVRVRGYEGAMGLIEGALEAPGFVPALGLEMETEYVLRPDTHLLEVRTTTRATTADVDLGEGDILLGADELLDAFSPGSGFALDPVSARAWNGYTSVRNDVAYAIAAAPGEQLHVAGYSLLTELAAMVVGFRDNAPLAAGEERTYTRFWGVGPDLATLSGEIQAAQGTGTQRVDGVVRAPDGPVAGARVVIDVDGAPYTVAVTGADGAWAADVPPGDVTTAIDGRGTGRFFDLPEGAAPLSPYAAAPPVATTLASLSDGAPAVPAAVGRGWSSDGDLGEPGTVVVSAGDGLPFRATLDFTEADPPTDPARISPRTGGFAAVGWARDGEVAMAVEPGTYDLVAVRGTRFEADAERVTVRAGQTTRVDVSLPSALAPSGWVLGDPHSHASPSPDGSVTMEERLIVAAALGVQVHFGTDHDHLADYRPLLGPLGLTGVLTTVVADEVSPPLRGHFNVYPVEPDPTAPNNGAWTWWTEIPESTDAMLANLRSRHGAGFVLQSNHPMDSGMGSAADWTPGRIGNPDFWSDRIEAMEVMNDGEVGNYYDIWADITTRGLRVTPTAVSDAHSYFDGHVGSSATWIHVGAAGPTPDAIAAAMHAGDVVPTNGPFLETSIAPGDVPPGSVVSVVAKGASYVKVDTIRWFEDGVEVEVVPDDRASRTLSPARDAVVWAIATGTEPMSPVSGDAPWALVGPFRVDVDGDGWEPPLPPLER